MSLKPHLFTGLTIVLIISAALIFLLISIQPNHSDFRAATDAPLVQVVPDRPISQDIQENELDLQNPILSQSEVLNAKKTEPENIIPVPEINVESPEQPNILAEPSQLDQNSQPIAPVHPVSSANLDTGEIAVNPAQATPLPTSTVIAPPPPPYEPQTEPITVTAPEQAIPNQVVLRFDSSTSEQERLAYIKSVGGSIIESIDELNTVVVNIPGDGGIQSLPESPLLAQTEPDYFMTVLEDPVRRDPRFTEQWALPVIGAPAAWDSMPTDAPTVIVAVIDSGICANHPDLVGRVLNTGMDFVDNDATPQDDFGHGCSVAGVIAANTGNDIGIAGVAPNAQIMPLRVLNAQGIGSYSDVAAAIVYAANNGAQIINLSLGGANPSTVLEDAVNYAVGRGVMIVAAAGNTGGSVLYPAAYSNVIAVGSVDPNLQLSGFSSRGPEIDLLAPGRDILTLNTTGDYRVVSGTSFAAPQVAGTAALEIAYGQHLAIKGQIVSFSPPINITQTVYPPIEPTQITPPAPTEPPTNEANHYQTAEEALLGALNRYLQISQSPVPLSISQSHVGATYAYAIAEASGQTQDEIFVTLLALREPDGRWHGIAPTLVPDSEFNQLLWQLPTKLIDDATKTFLTLVDSPDVSSLNFSNHYLPWQNQRIGYLTTKGNCTATNCNRTGHETQLDFDIQGNGTSGQVYASKSGTVIFAKEVSYSGSCSLSSWQQANMVIVQHGPSEYSWYVHLAYNSVEVTVGQNVGPGTLIGTEGETGYACGVHLHYMTSTGHNNNLGQPNNPDVAPWATGITAVDFVEVSWSSLTPGGAYTSQNAGSGGGSACQTYSYNGIVLFPDAQCTGSNPRSYSGAGFRNMTDENFNDVASSIHIGSGWSVRVWQDTNRGGDSRCMTGSMWDLSVDYYDNSSRNINNDISSIEVFNNSNCGGGGTPSGNWTANYYDTVDRWWDTNNSGNHRCTETINGPQLDFNYGTSARCGMDGDTWIGDYSATINFPSGTYVFRVEHDDGLRLWLGTQNIADRSSSGSAWICPARSLSGNQNLRVMLREDGGDARVYVNWTTDTSVCVTPPNAPSLNSPANGATAGRYDNVTLSWNGVSGATEYYAEFWGGPNLNLNSGWTTNTTWFIGSQWGGNYQWRVRARNSAGESAWSETRSFTIQYGSPGNLSATATSQTNINLSWLDSADGPGNIDGYRIYRNGSAIGTVGSSTLTYGNGGLSCGTSYSYTVRAYRGTSESPNSNTANATTQNCVTDTTPPTGALTSPANSSHHRVSPIALTANASDSQSGVSHVDFLAISDSPWSGQQWITLGSDTTAPYSINWDITAIQDGSVLVSVFVYDNANNNYWNTNLVRIFIDRTAPTSAVNSLASSQPSTSFSISWGGNDNIEGTDQQLTYDIQYQLGCTGSWTNWQTATTQTSATFTGTAGQSYCFRSRATDRAGNVEAYPTTADASTTIASAPNAPSNFHVTATTANSITIAWQDNSNSETGFRIFRWNGSSFPLYATVGANVVSYTDSNLPCNASQFYELSAYNAQGESSHVGWIEGRTTACPPANDLFANANLVNSLPYTYTQDIHGSTVSGTDPIMCTGSGINSVWYRYTATVNQPITITTNGSGYDTVLGVYTGTSGSLVERACDDDNGSDNNSRLNFNVVAGTTYYILVTNYSGTPVSTATTLRLHVTNVSDTIALFNPNSRWASLISSPVTVAQPPASAYTNYDTGSTQNGQWVMGDWDGDGQKTPGVYSSNGVFYFTNSLGASTTQWTGIWFGLFGRPAVAGHFGAGLNDCIGVVDSGNFPPYGLAFAMYFTCDMSGGNPPKTFQWLSVLLPDSQGHSGNFQFAAGDFNNDGFDSVAVRRGLFIAWTNVPPTTMLSEFSFAQYFNTGVVGAYGDLVAGDWNNDGVDSFGLVYQNGYFASRNDVEWNPPNVPYNWQFLGTPIGSPIQVATWRSGIGVSGSQGTMGLGVDVTPIPTATIPSPALTPIPPVDTPPSTNHRIESEDVMVSRYGGWIFQEANAASRGGYLYSSGLQDTLTLAFTGTSIEIVYLEGQSLGTFTILIDDVAVRTVVATSGQTTFDVKTKIDYLTDEPHSLRIEPIEGSVAIDAFIVTQSVGN